MITELETDASVRGEGGGRRVNVVATKETHLNVHLLPLLSVLINCGHFTYQMEICADLVA